MKTIGLYEAKTNLSSLVAELEENGETILLTRHGKVVAELSPATPLVAPVRGSLKSANFSMAEDFDTAEVGFEDFYKSDVEEVLLVAEDPSEYNK